jgi:hypothetical protein
MAGTYEIPAIGSSNESQEPKIKTFIESWNGKLDSTNSLEGANLSKGVLGRWYAPVEIATEQERESATFGKLATPDEVTGVVLPKNGLIVIGYRAFFKSSVNNAGKAAIFLGANQLKVWGMGAPIVQETSTEGTAEIHPLVSSPNGLATVGTVSTSVVTTGQALSAFQGLCYVFAEAGTYSVSVQFKATSGKVAAKERVLQVGVIGV